MSKPHAPRRAAWLVAGLICAPAHAEGPAWPPDFFDPGATQHGAADLILPMPCGGAMAFQRVIVPLNAEDPLADRAVRLGNSLEATAFVEYFLTQHLRGAFETGTSAGSDAGNNSHYYIARYEMNQAQLRALRGDCAAPGRVDRLAAGGLSWFDGVALAQGYSSWLIAHARADLPQRDGVPGFVRLPTEVEWEFATRGGAMVDPARFAGSVHFGEDGDMLRHAFVQAPGSARGGALGPVGTRAPNPLGLFDVYGNAEELVLEPFRLNAFGRAHGQPGGVVTRGGSVLSTPEQVYSAHRTEYPPFDPGTGVPLAGPTFGLRLVISAPVTTTDARIDALRLRWQSREDDPVTTEAGIAAAPVDGAPAGDADAPARDRLEAMIAREADAAQRQALVEVRLALLQSDAQAQTALQRSAQSAMLTGAVIAQTLNRIAAEIAHLSTEIARTNEFLRVAPESERASLRDAVRSLGRQLQTQRQQQATFLRSWRAVLETLAFEVPQTALRAATGIVRDELLLTRQQPLAEAVDRVQRAALAFQQEPDMSESAIADLARP
jgi:hypothetical protein